MLFAYVVLFALYLYTVSSHVLFSLGPFAVLGVGAVGAGIFFLSVISVKWLVTMDARLATLPVLYFNSRRLPTFVPWSVVSDSKRQTTATPALFYRIFA
jgi:hypothetical protein